MLKWFHCEGWRSGPYDDEMIILLREKALKQNPQAVIRVEPAWEAPFERMLTAQVRHFRPGAKDDRQRMFLFKADKRFYWFVSNLRCSLKIRREDGRAPYRPLGHPSHLEKSEQAALDAKIREASGGKDTWDCGWSPAIP